MNWKTKRDADWKVLDGSSKYASWQSSSKRRSGWGTQTDPGVSMRHSCQKTWGSAVENGQQAKQIKLVIQENSKPQYFIVYTDGSVTKDQSGLGSTVKQCATTIHEGTAAYTVWTSSLAMEVQAVTHAFRWIASRSDSRTTHATILTDSISLLQKVSSGMGSSDWNVSMVDIHCRKLLWVYCPGHAGEKRNDQADRLAGKSNPHKWLASRKKLRSTKPRTSHYRSPGRKRNVKRKR